MFLFFSMNISSVFGGITTGFEFLKIDFSPRSSAMSGASLTFTNDVSAMFINPAGLANVEPKQFSFNYSNYLLDISGGMAVYSHPIPVLGRLNFGILYFDYGQFTETDEFAVETGNLFSANDFMFGVGVANTLAERYTYGINLKYAFSKIDQYNASAVALDFGLIYHAPFVEGLNFAVTLLNLGTNFEYYSSQKETLPINLSIGGSKKLARLPLVISFCFKQLTDHAENFSDYFKRFSIGGEFTLSDALRLRLGYDNRLHSDLKTTTDEKFGGLSAGAGFYWRTLRFDYAYSNFSSLGSIHRIGIVGTIW